MGGVEPALRVFPPEATRRLWTAALVLLAALRRIGQAVRCGKSGGTKKHGRSK